jgi:hypothetical protein
MGSVRELTRPESRLDYALWRSEQQGLEAIHISFLPLHLTYLTARAPNIVFPSWEFPDIPSTNLGNNPRNNWARIAEHVSLIVCHSRTARDAFLRAGVKTPLELIPIPVADDYFSLSLWQPDASIRLDCPCFEFPENELSAQSFAEAARSLETAGLKEYCRRAYRHWLKPYLPQLVDREMWRAARAASLVREPLPEEAVPCTLRPSVRLSGIVYTTIFNPFDPRKNWQDILTSFLIAFADRSDVSLVMKLVVRPELLRQGLLEVFDFYRKSGLKHRCKVVLIWSYLSQGQMLSLAKASTFYLNASRAEGSCLPLQNFLAAGRPGVAPVHSGLGDYFDEQLGFPIDSHPEPASFPHDPDERLFTSWHRVVWSSLHDQLLASYKFVRDGYEEYRAMGTRARAGMQDHAGHGAIRPQLVQALETVTQATRS